MATALRLRHLPALLYRPSLAVVRGTPQAPAGCPALLLLPGGCGQRAHPVLLARQLATKKGNGGSRFPGVCDPSVRRQGFFSHPFYLVYRY